MRFQIAGWCRAIQFASASAWKNRTVCLTPPSAKSAPHVPPIGFSPPVRRRSGQTIAGRSGSPAASRLMTDPRCVVSATPRTASLGTGDSRQSCWQLSATARQK